MAPSSGHIKLTATVSFLSVARIQGLLCARFSASTETGTPSPGPQSAHNLVGGVCWQQHKGEVVGAVKVEQTCDLGKAWAAQNPARRSFNLLKHQDVSLCDCGSACAFQKHKPSPHVRASERTHLQERKTRISHRSLETFYSLSWTTFHDKVSGNKDVVVRTPGFLVVLSLQLCT